MTLRTSTAGNGRQSSSWTQRRRAGTRRARRRWCKCFMLDAVDYPSRDLRRSVPRGPRRSRSVGNRGSEFRARTGLSICRRRSTSAGARRSIELDSTSSTTRALRSAAPRWVVFDKESDELIRGDLGLPATHRDRQRILERLELGVGSTDAGRGYPNGFRPRDRLLARPEKELRSIEALRTVQW